ncbi:MAG: acyl-CoA dehydrogenase family protein [Armatimonadetes bacterium]|nr:acyl-CoA dehydrogenase family protein [Armatimonadota bacterium]
MDFQLTEEHKLVQESMRSFVEREVAPNIREWDRNGAPRSVFNKLAETGALGICFPRQYGGQGMDYISLGLTCEELEYGDTFLRVAMSVHVGLSGMSIFSWGTEEQKQRFLRPQATGERLGAFCLTEPNAGSDVVGLQSTAKKDGESYILNGEKIWISLSDYADQFLVVAWTDLEKKAKRDHSGMTAFIVERTMPGIKTYAIHGKLGVRAGNTGGVVFDNVRVPAENRLGEEGEGFKIAMFSLDNGRYTVASGSAGLIRACLEASVKYAQERKTAGVPISQHQLIKQKVAHMEADYQISRLLYLRAGWMKNVGQRNTKETSLAKWYSTDAANRAANQAVQLFGAYGFADEYPVERFYRNSKGAQIYEGTSDIHTLMQADYLFGNRQDKPSRVNLPTWPFDG